jgi:hypothetical protein
MLLDYPDIVLESLAELRNAFLESAETREQRIELLAAQITDPTSVQMAYEEVLDEAPESRDAIEALLKEGGELAEAQFSRQFGGIRQMGPAKLARETPWEFPESVAERLYYYGFIGRSFKGIGQQAHTVIYIPSDITPWLPQPENPALEAGLPVRPVLPPPAARVQYADDSLLEDIGTLLGFLRTEPLRLTPAGPHPEDIDRFVQRLQVPFMEDDPYLNVRLALLLHLAKRLGWLRRGDDGSVQLTRNRVELFLDQPRAKQRRALWDAWLESPDWNDLCRTPGLECAETGNWKNDPRQTRAAALPLFAKLQPSAWYSQSEVIRAIRQTEPDFQRPTGNYDTWYIRSTTTQEFLKGFEQWDAVEGALLRFLIRGPLHWLGALHLAEPSAGDDYQFSLSEWGRVWLGQDAPPPHEASPRPTVVGDDFSVTLPLGTALADRYRIEEFAAWQASYPHFVYQINQRSLKRAADAGIAVDKVLEFLEAHARPLPAKVHAALARFSAGERVR